jgi:hypothetical protein
MAKRFTLSNKKYDQRPLATLLTYSFAEKKAQPHLVDPYDEVGPGLYPDESVYTLDTGEEVAISVKPKWEPNGMGLSLTVWGRWINEDGSTKLDADGQEVEVAYSHGFDAEAAEKYDLSVLMKEMLLLVLGEEAEEEEDVHVDPEAEDPMIPPE